MSKPRKVRIRGARTLMGFNWFSGRKRTITGRSMTELADENLRTRTESRLSVKKTAGRRRNKYRAVYWPASGRPLTTREQANRARGLVFHHEKGFPLNSKSLLATFETYFGSFLLSEPISPNDSYPIRNLELLRSHQDSLDRHAEQSLEILENELMKSDSYRPNFEWVFHYAYRMFPDKLSFAKAVIRMTRKRSNMRGYLEKLNKIEAQNVRENFEEVKHISLKMLNYLYLEAVKAAERPWRKPWEKKHWM
ncbi:MAG: hypothetical protein HY392_02350 [Candidatus Diapherotrites archaeon]|nr:hypothetical protein [Candidatus Diapherotrites archaeon]